jgi:hypothetical protein
MNAIKIEKSHFDQSSMQIILRIVMYKYFLQRILQMIA